MLTVCTQNTRVAIKTLTERVDLVSSKAIRFLEAFEIVQTRRIGPPVPLPGRGQVFPIAVCIIVAVKALPR